MTRVSSFQGPDVPVPVVPTRAVQNRALHVAIEAQITQGVQGGLEQYLMALAAGLRDEAGGAVGVYRPRVERGSRLDAAVRRTGSRDRGAASRGLDRLKV